MRLPGVPNYAVSNSGQVLNASTMSFEQRLSMTYFFPSRSLINLVNDDLERSWHSILAAIPQFFFQSDSHVPRKKKEEKENRDLRYIREGFYMISSIYGTKTWKCHEPPEKIEAGIGLINTQSHEF